MTATTKTYPCKVTDSWMASLEYAYIGITKKQAGTSDPGFFTSETLTKKVKK